MIVGRTVNYRRIRNAVAAHRARTAWTPTAIFADGQQGVWLEASPTYQGQQVLWQQSDGTVIVDANGDPVGRDDDLSPNGNNATQSTSADRPLYGTDGTLHWLQGDGAGDHMVIPQTTFAGEFLLSVALRADDTSSMMILGGATSSETQKLGTNTGDWFLRLIDGGSSITGGTQDTFPHVLSVTRDLSDTVNFYIDGVILSSMVQAGTIDFRTILRTLNVSAPWFGRMYGFVMTGQPSARENVDNYLANLAGITL